MLNKTPRIPAKEARVFMRWLNDTFGTDADAVLAEMDRRREAGGPDIQFRVMGDGGLMLRLNPAVAK